MRVGVGVGVGDGVTVGEAAGEPEPEGLTSGATIPSTVAVGVVEGAGWALRLPKKKAPAPTMISKRKKIMAIKVVCGGFSFGFGVSLGA